MPGTLAVCRLAAEAPWPAWATGREFVSLTRTAEELSIVLPQERVPDGVACERDFRCLKLEGPFDFSQVGVLASVLDPLAEAGISIFATSTYDTDYVLVKTGKLERALEALRQAGHEIKRET